MIFNKKDKKLSTTFLFKTSDFYFSYQLSRRSYLSTAINLRINSGQVFVTARPLINLSVINLFLQKNQNQIKSTLLAYQKYQKLKLMVAEPFVIINDQRYLIKYSPDCQT